mmetsp:Transcript_33637/g.81482  ORF Transcript_33637/g.81482 Transcript_33637/m.81482 type:complete len:221 (-) Transcript_33637:244-906(-)
MSENQGKEASASKPPPLENDTKQELAEPEEGTNDDQKEKKEGEGEEDEELAAWEKKLKETEEKIQKIEAMSSSYDGASGGSKTPTVVNGPEVDKRSIYVGNVDYQTTPDELKELFSPCGTVNRVTILCNKATGQPLGYAYVEFQDESAVENAKLLDSHQFKGRELKISEKKTKTRRFGGYRRPRYRRRRSRRFYRPRYGRKNFSNRRGIYRPYTASESND